MIIDRNSMNVKITSQIPSHISSQRFFVRKRDIINSLTSITILTDTLISSSSSLNQNCCGRETKIVQLPPVKIKTIPNTKDNLISKLDEFINDIPKQTTITEVVSNEKLPLLHEILNNAWPLSNERVENMTITNKRCYFSNEAISIKPITAIPGIGKKYGQILADHGFIYARQLLGYYLMLKDSEMFRKWLEYKFHIKKFRAAEITSALNELVRQTL